MPSTREIQRTRQWVRKPLETNVFSHLKNTKYSGYFVTRGAADTDVGDDVPNYVVEKIRNLSAVSIPPNNLSNLAYMQT